jgi:hypothetical protein
MHCFNAAAALASMCRARSGSSVVAGHKKVDNDNDPKIIAESQQYLRDFTRIAAEQTTTASIVARMADLYPGWETSAHSGTPPDQPSRARTAKFLAAGCRQTGPCSGCSAGWS